MSLTTSIPTSRSTGGIRTNCSSTIAPACEGCSRRSTTTGFNVGWSFATTMRSQSSTSAITGVFCRSRAQSPDSWWRRCRRSIPRIAARTTRCASASERLRRCSRGCLRVLRDREMPACSTVSAAIEISDLRHHYGDREALRGVTFRVDRGEIFALLGPNGGGKTTLFRILSTLMRPASGEARVLGHDLARDAAAVRPRLGVVFQNPGLDPKLTVGENLVHHGHLYGLGGAPLRERVKQLLGDLDLSDRANDRVETL